MENLIIQLTVYSVEKYSRYQPTASKILKHCFIYLFIHRRLSTQNKITKQWQNDYATIQSKLPFHGPVRLTSLEWKLCHTSLVLKLNWQIQGLKHCLCYWIFQINSELLAFAYKLQCCQILFFSGINATKLFSL